MFNQLLSLFSSRLKLVALCLNAFEVTMFMTLSNGSGGSGNAWCLSQLESVARAHFPAASSFAANQGARRGAVEGFDFRVAA